MSGVFKLLYEVFTTRSLSEQETSADKLLKGVYITTYNDCGEKRIIHDPRDTAITKDDKIFENKHDLEILRLKCEDLLSYFKRMVLPERRRDKDFEMRGRLCDLIDDIYLEIDDTKDVSYDHLVTKYEACKVYIKRTRSSYNDLNRLKS
jgi:hypothetical protein